MVDILKNLKVVPYHLSRPSLEAKALSATQTLIDFLSTVTNITTTELIPVVQMKNRYKMKKGLPLLSLRGR